MSRKNWLKLCTMIKMNYLILSEMTTQQNNVQRADLLLRDMTHCHVMDKDALSSQVDLDKDALSSQVDQLLCYVVLRNSQEPNRNQLVKRFSSKQPSALHGKLFCLA